MAFEWKRLKKVYMVPFLLSYHKIDVIGFEKMCTVGPFLEIYLSTLSVYLLELSPKSTKLCYVLCFNFTQEQRRLLLLQNGGHYEISDGVSSNSVSRSYSENL